MKTSKETLNILIRYVFIVFICISLTYILFLHIAFRESNSFVFDDETVVKWNDGWDINYDGNIEEGISLPCEVPAKHGSSVILRKTLPDKIKKYNCIMLEGKRQDITVSIGGIQRASFSNKDYRVYGKTSPSGYIIVPLYNTDSLEDVAIHVSSDSDFSGKIGEIYIGSEKSLLMMIVKSNMISLFLIAIVFIIGIVCLVCYFSYGADYEISKAMRYLAIFAVASSVWSFTQSELRQLFIKDLTSFEAFGYCFYMLLPIFFAFYVDYITDHKYVKAINVYLLAVIINFVVENSLRIIMKIGFYEMRFVSQAIYVTGAIFIMMLALGEARVEFSAKAKSLLIGTAGLLIGLLTEVNFQNTRAWAASYNYYIVGAFIFLASSFVYTMLCVGGERRKRKDAESESMAKSLFLASISHEIKTPINAVLGMNEMIMRDSSEDFIREYAANVNDAGKALLSLVNDVLDFSKIESGKMAIECVNYQMKSLLRDVISTAEAKANQKSLKFNIEIDENIPCAYYGDEIRIKQILTNLLSNAVKYTKNGEVTLLVENKGIKDGEILLHFAVKDTGEGIREEDIERFKDSFVRIEQVRNSNIEGLGLGLSITTQLLKMMNSDLEIESVYGQGSTFGFTLLQRITDKTAMGPIKAVNKPTTKARKITFTAPDAHILAVDDNRMNITVLAGILKPTKIQVDTCNSGKACLELCKDNRYDIIFMDHMMPEMDGIETFKRLRADNSLKSSESIVVVLTANTVSGAGEMYKECGFDYYFKKPIDVNELNDVLQKYIPDDMISPLEAANY